MKKLLLTRSLLLVALFFSGSTLLAQTQVCGTVNLELYDSYGDGWNGNEIDVKFTGGDSTYTLSSGSFISIPLSVNYLDTAQFAWQAGGSYTSECTYKITDASGTVLYSSPTGNNMTAGSTQYTAYCATAPVPQVCGTVTLELYDSYGDGWNGNDMDVVTSSGTTTYGMSSGSFISYTLTIAYQDTAHFIWQAGGSYASECTYIVKDAYGTTLYSSPNGGLMTAGATQYSAQCNSLASCIAPTNLSVTTGAYDAAVSWDAGASAYAYHLVEYDTAGFTPGTGDTMWVYSDTAYITGLDPATSYDFFVTTLCSATDSSAATASLGQFTQCAALATPWSENFDNAATGSANNPSLPQCWDFYTTGVGTYYYPYIYNRNYSFYANSGSNFLYAYRSSSTSTSPAYADTTMAIMPEIQGLDSATKQLKFYARTTSVGRPGEVMIGFTDAAGTPGSLRIIDTVYAPSTSYSEYTVYLDGATTGDARVAFILRHNSTFDYICIDDVSITDIPPCPEPIGLSLTGTTQTTGTISWSSSSAAFNIEVGPMGFTQGTGTSYTSTTTSYTATGLVQNTYYDAYVMSNCTSTGDGTSNWVGPFTFKTECGDQAVPYSTGFEGYTDGSTGNPDLPDCWAYAKTGTSSSFYAYNYDYSFYANTGINAVRFYGYVSTTSTNSADGDTLAVYSPRIAGLGGNDKQVIFSGRGGSTSASYVNQIIIATADTNASLGSLHIVDTVAFTGTTYGDYTIDLDNVPATASRVVFLMIPEFPSGYTYGYNYAYIDDVEIRDIPNCPIAVNAIGMANSDSSATLTWVDSSAVTNYIIEWGPSGFTQGTGAPTDTVTGTSWSINTLDDATTYDFYIQSNCMSTNGSMSPWVGPITVDVPCSPTAAPFADGFENKPAAYGNSINPNLPDCWTYSVNSNPGNSYSYASTSSFSSYSGTGYVYNRQSNVAGDTVVVSLPMIEDLNQGGLQLKFWARTSSTFYPGQMSVATTDASGNYSSAVVAKNMNVGSTTYQQYSVYLDSNVVTSDSRRPAFLFYSASGSYNYIYLDSVEVEAIPACINYNQMASNVSSSSADLTWSYTGANCFNVEYGPAGFIQGTGVGALSGTLDTNVTAPYSLTGLNPNTGYDFYVQNCCSSTWEGPFTFQTECTGPLAAGTYSVGPTGDFATLDSVTSTLNVCGIGGAVTFEFQSGSFSTSSYLGEINGSSMTNTITFKGSTSANDTIIAGTDAAFVLEGAKYMNFEDLFIYTPNNSGFRLNGSSDISITGNTIMSNTTSTSSVINAIIASASATSAFSTTVGEQNITIENNDIMGGYYGIRFYGSMAARNGDIVISGNTMTDQYYYGIYVYYGDNVEISDNELSGFRSNFAYGVYPYQVNGCQITGNHISDLYYGIYGYYLSSTSTANAPSEITNNMINAGYYGLNVLYSDSVGIYHNTAVGGYAGVRDYYNAANVNFRNNIFAGGTYALYNYNTSAFGDYNLYYSTGTSLGYSYVSSPYAVTYIDSLGQLQSMDSTMHMNSVEGDPIFATATDLHVYGPLANDAGDNTVGVTVDIDGDARPMSGSTTVDIGADEYDVIGDDAALTALLNPANGICGDDSLMVSVQIANNGQNTLTSLTVSVDIFGTTMTATPTGLSVPFGGKDTVELGYISNFVGGTYAVVAYTQLTGDGRPGNDTLSLSVDVTDAQQVTPVYPEFICAGDDVNLSVTNPTQGKVMWASGNDTIAVVDADSTIMLSSVMMDTTITVSSINYTESVGQLSPGSGYSYTGAYGLSFTAYSGMSLDSVTLFPSGAGTSTIVIEDASGTQLYSIPVTTSATGYAAEQVYLGASLSSGSYKIWLNGTTTGGLYDNLNSTFPYWSGDSSVVITGDRNGGTSWYEYFYDWKVTVGGCEREDSTFTVGIYPDAVAAISIDTANATISATDWMANWSTAGTTDADSIYVEFSNGTSSNDTSGTVTFTANNAGETVTVIAFGPCSSDTATFTFDVNQISVDEDFLNGTLSIYPNPTRGLFNVEFATATATNVEISIVNMVGQVISNEVVTVNGLYNNQFDLSDESAGVYFIKFTTDEGVLTERITVE
jgi:parallel beta-helix repeat protein